MANPIQYSELYAKDVQQGIEELNSLASQTDVIFQDLAKTLIATNGRVTASIKAETEALNKLRAAVTDVDVAQKGAAETLIKAAGNTDALATKVKNLKDQKKGLKDMLDLASGSVDANKAKIAQLTAEYNALGTSTDKNKAKMQAILKEVTALAKEQINLTSAMSSAKKGIDAAEGSYNRMVQQLAKYRKTLNDLPNAVNASTGAINKNNAAAVDLARKINLLDIAVKKYDASLGNHQRNVGNYTGALNNAGNQLANLAAGYLSVQAAMDLAGKAFNSSLQIDSIRTVLEFTFKSADIADQKLRMLRETADRLGVGYLDLAASYKSFTAAAIASNFPIAQAEKIFLSVSNAGAKMKLTSEQMSGALLALQQMISKGNVQAEELRGQLSERLPGAFAIAARAMGVTETKLNDLLKDGKVLASDLLPKLATELDKTFGNDKTERIESLQSSWERLKNTFDFTVESSRVGAFFKYLIDSLEGVASRFSKIVNSSSWKEFFLRIGGIAQVGTGAGSAMEAFADIEALGNRPKDKDFVQTPGAALTGLDAKKGKTEKAKTALDLLKEKIDAITLSLKLQALQAIETKKAYTPDPETLAQLAKLEDQLGFADRMGREAQLDDTFAIKGTKQDQNRITNTAAGFSWKDDLQKITAPDQARQAAPLMEWQKLLDAFADAERKGQQDITKVYSEEIQKRLAETEKAKLALMSAMDVMRESGLVLGEIFGPEFGGLFDQITTDVEKFFSVAEDGTLRFEANFEDLAKTGIASIRAINEAFQQGSDLRIEKLQLEKQAQVDIAGTNKDARLNIEKEYNDKIRAERIKQARTNKTAAIFEIAINTAIAASKVTAQTGLLGIPLIPLIIALGAVQIAAVLARPIPKFRHGRDGGAATIAEVNEDGPEALVYQGQVRFANQGRRGLTYLRENEKVVTAPITAKMMQVREIDQTTEMHSRLSKNLHEGVRQDKIDIMTVAYKAARISEEAIGQSVGREIAKLPFQSTTWDERGIIKHIQKGNTTTKMLNERYSLK